MLALYVALLREIAMADAELASKRRAWEARQAQAEAAEAAWRREQERSEPEAPEQTAEIIDISRRVGDGVYDQYADAAVRAVGD
jgi:septal ring factor EnvC (AmiA/AmiB activator)